MIQSQDDSCCCNSWSRFIQFWSLCLWGLKSFPPLICLPFPESLLQGWGLCFGLCCPLHQGTSDTVHDFRHCDRAQSLVTKGVVLELTSQQVMPVVTSREAALCLDFTVKSQLCLQLVYLLPAKKSVNR